MAAVHWFDSAAARAAADGWTRWAERLDVDGRALRLELDALAMTAWDDGPRLLDTAADLLWTLAAFTLRVSGAVDRADGSFPSTADRVDELWTEAGRHLAMAEAARDARADAAARLRRLRSLDADLRRIELERGRSVTDALAELSADEALLYWPTLTLAEQRTVTAERPDLVAFRVLANGGTLAPIVLETLAQANSHARLTEQFELKLDVEVGLRLVTLEIGAGLSVITTTLSDGSVELTLVEDAEVGAGVEIDVPRAAEAGASVGAFGELRQRFRFADEAQAIAAIDVLRSAVRQDASFGELTKDVGGAGWNVAVAPTNAGIAFTNWLIPFADPVPSVPTYDLTPHTVRELQELWLTHGLSRQEAAGAYVGVSAEFEANAGLIEAELDAEADQRIMAYDTDVADADTTGARGQTGLMISGTASVDVDGTLGGPGRDLGGHAAASTGYVLDLHHIDGDGTYLTVTLDADVAAGGAIELVDLGAVDVDVTADETAAMTVSITVPVNGATTGAVGEVGVDLARGVLPLAALGELYDLAEVEVTVTTGTETAAELDVDAGVVTVDAATSSAHDVTRMALHKYPGGELYARDEIDHLIDTSSD